MTLYHTPFDLMADVVGDGVVVIRLCDGSFRVHEIEFSNNAPGYLTYLLDGGRYASFVEGTLQEAGGVRTIRETWWDSVFDRMIDEPVILKEGLDRGSFWHSIAHMRDDCDLIVAFSDGVLSFQRKTGFGSLENVPLQEVLRQLMAFKGLNGEFVKRRCRKFFRKFCVENGWSHHDDFSMVALYDDRR
jgi:hypothetical protein